jgi:hypothetical protein
LPLPTPTMRRLTIVKYLHAQALEQERKGGPLAGLALLPLHDAVELFLQVAAETHQLTLRKSADFIEYWTEFSNADRPLRYQQQMRRFNNAHVEVKHRGTLPSQPDVEGFRATVTNFLVETTPELFEIDFNSISLSSLVQSDGVAGGGDRRRGRRIWRGPGTSRESVSSVPAKPPVARDASPLRPNRRRP